MVSILRAGATFAAVDVPAYFADLGRAVSSAWSAAGRKDGVLPEVAERALTSVEVPAELDGLSILRWIARTSDLPPQSRVGDSFGEPPLVLHYEEDFYIQVLTWMDGTTAIHQHGFAGAFMVLEGASLHAVHRFALGERLAEDRLVVGDLSIVAPEVLRRHDVRRIEPGDEFIHALFHLERPTVTIVIRNMASDLPYPQYTYLAPGIGWEGNWRDRTWSKRLESVDTVLRLDPTVGRRTMQDLVSGQASLWEAWCLVDHWRRHHFWDEVAADLTDRLTARATPLAAVLAPAMEQDARSRRVLARRGMLDVLHQRVFLALLANLPDAASIGTVLEQLFPGRPPADLLLEWAEELSAPSLRGVSGLKLAPGRIEELRSAPMEGREHEVLAEIRAAWGEPRQVARLQH